MASMNDLRSPLVLDMNRDIETGSIEAGSDSDFIEVEADQDQNQVRRAKNYTKCFRVFAILLILGLMGWVISLIIRQKYKKIEKTSSNKKLILKSSESSSESSLESSSDQRISTYIKYFAKNGENPMHCTGSYCWSWQTPNKVVCTVKNNAKPWNNDVSWMCEADCPNYYDLDMIKITCSPDDNVATNPHLGCNLVYSMSYSSYVTEIDWETLGSFISMICLCMFLLILIAVCANTQPGYSSLGSSRNSGPDACDVYMCFIMLNSCNNRGYSHGGHRSTTWG